MTDMATPASIDASAKALPNWPVIWRADQASKKADHDARMKEITCEVDREKRQRYEAKRREDVRINSRNYRARIRTKAQEAYDALLPDMLRVLDPAERDHATWLSTELIALEVRQFGEWLSIGGHRQAPYRKHKHSYMRSRVALLEARAEFGSNPSYTEFGRFLARVVGGDWDKEAARTRLNALRRLEGADGPWDVRYPGDKAVR